MALGKRVREEREGQGLTQGDLARRAGLSLNAVARVERGERVPSARTVEKLARGLGVEPGDLFPKAQASLPFSSVNEERRNYSERWVSQVALQALLELAAEQGEVLVEKLMTAPGVPVGLIGKFLERDATQDVLYEEAVREGWSTKEIDEDKQRFEQVASRLVPLINQMADREQRRQLEQLKARRAARAGDPEGQPERRRDETA